MRAHLVDGLSPAALFLFLAVGGYAYAFYHFHHNGWLARLRRRGRFKPWQPWCYVAGILLIVVALFSPAHDLAGELLSMHMVQHVLLMMPAPLLILLGLPSPILRWLILKSGTRSILAVVTQPMAAFLVFNANLLVWHLPGFYQATLTNEFIHDLQHALFFYTGLFYFWRLIDPTHGWFPFWGWSPARWLYLMVAAPPSYILGSILWASNTILYPAYDRVRPAGVAALRDQSSAGMIMWLQGWMFVMASMVVFFLNYEPGLEQAQE